MKAGPVAALGLISRQKSCSGGVGGIRKRIRGRKIRGFRNADDVNVGRAGGIHSDAVAIIKACRRPNRWNRSAEPRQ